MGTIKVTFLYESSLPPKLLFLMRHYGIHPTYGITNDDEPNFVGSDSGILEIAKKAIVIADHTKIGFKAKRLLSSIDCVDTLITTTLAPRAVLDAFRDHGIKVVTVEFFDAR